METQSQNAINPNTNQEYRIEFPAREIVRQAILDLEYPSDGITVKDATIILITKFNLPDEQKNAVNRSNLNVFRYNVIAPQFRQLLQKGKLVQPCGPRTPYFLAGSENIPPETETKDNSTESRDMSSVETTTRTTVDPAGNEYDIKVPATNVVKNALCNFEYPPGGIRIKDVADALTGEFDLNDEQVNARHRTGYKIFLNHVNTAANALVNSEKLLKIKRGWIINPDQFEDITPDDMSSSGEDTPSPEVVMERSYQEIQNNLEAELLNKIKDNPPEFFEQLVLDLLVEMGYGGSRADAEVVGRIGDGGIDGIIKEDPLGLDIVYVQAKRWENNVPEKEIRDFTGALASKGARKGIFITTSGFAKPAIKFAKDMTTKKVILIDGDQLVQLMIKYNVGVSEGNTYQTKQVDSEYFGEVEE